MQNQTAHAETSASIFTTLLFMVARQTAQSIACDDTAEFQINAETRSGCAGTRRTRSAATLRAFASLILTIGDKNSKEIEKSLEQDGTVRCYRLRQASTLAVHCDGKT